MARPDPDDYTKNELANRCYEFSAVVERIGRAYQKWNGDLAVERLVDLRGEEIDERVAKLKAAFSLIASEKTGWQVDEAISIPLHPRHDMKDRATIRIEIRLLASGESEYFSVTVPREDGRGNVQFPPITFRVDQ